MTKQTFLFLILTILFTSSSAKQWYEQGHTNFLTWKNFNDAVKEPGKYKFVKFFTHNCRYCRMLKQVEEKLMKEKDWPFRFYNVDCSKHYDLCKKTVNARSFPFVGIYNLEGQLESKISGYYPVDVMRDALNAISEKQQNALKKVKVAPKVESKAS